jgi:hypothetical protein
MAISDDFTINTSTLKISHTSGTTVYSANALYSWLMEVFAGSSYMSFDVPMSAQTPTAYSMINSWTFNADSDLQYVNGGAITVNPGASQDLWANIYTIGSIVTPTTVYVAQNGTVITGYWPNGHIDIVVKVQSAGTLIDSGNLTIYAREYGALYDHFQVDASGGGRNPIPLATSSDINNTTAELTVAGYSDIALTFGNANHDLNNGNGAQPYGLSIDCAGRTLAQVYEYLKYLTRRGCVTLLNGVQGQQYWSVNSYTALKAAPFGTFAGGKFFGAQGVWITNYAANQSFQLIDNNGVVQAPPNTVYVSVTGLVAGDRVAVFKLVGVGGIIEKTTYNVDSKTASTIVMVEDIASDTPQAGYLRVIHAGVELLFAYTSWASKTFSGVTPDPTGTAIVATDDAYVPYIDAAAAGANLSNSLIYAADRNVRVRVRKKGILPFEIDGVIGSSGLTQAAIRTTDSIVT